MDKTGSEILHVISKASRFNRWMFETIAPFCQHSILEVGSGIGNISEFFAVNNYEISLSDVDKYYVDLLNERFAGYQNVRSVLDIDLQLPGFSEKYSLLKDKYNTIVLLNVLEHLENEDYAIQNCKFLLQTGGILIILVPAYTFLYSKLDKELGHFRRYNSKRLRKSLIKNGMIPQKVFYFNALGIGAWLYGKIFSLKTIPQSEMTFFDKITTIAKFMDRVVFHKAGLSVIAISSK